MQVFDPFGLDFNPGEKRFELFSGLMVNCPNPDLGKDSGA
jgi:hypothetical protein